VCVLACWHVRCRMAKDSVRPTSLPPGRSVIHWPDVQNRCGSRDTSRPYASSVVQAPPIPWLRRMVTPLPLLLVVARTAEVGIARLLNQAGGAVGHCQGAAVHRRRRRKQI
jgi:hypothetical protein